MRALRLYLLLVFSSALVATALAAADKTADAAASRHRYLVERSFPAGALDGLDAATKQRVNSNNAELGVAWIHSYANAEKTRTWCVYEGPSEAAIRQAAEKNGLPVDSVVEIPVDLTPR